MNMICVFISVFLALTLWVQYICVCSCSLTRACSPVVWCLSGLSLDMPVMRILRASNEGAFREAFNSLLANPEFLGDGGTLTFGLRHVYPIKDSLKHVYSVLKGSDAVVYHSVRALGFQPVLYLYYETSRCEGHFKGVLVDKMVDFSEAEYNSDGDVGEVTEIIRDMGGIVVHQQG